MSGAPAPTPKSALEAVAYSRRWRTWTPKGYCANHVASCYTDGLKLMQFGIGSANEAWSKATQRETSKNPPPGAPVYWSSGKWGHIAISVGGGRVRSTDWPTDTLLGECTIDEMGKRWPGMTYRGWSRDMCGHPIPGLEKPVAPPKPTAPAKPKIPAPPRYDFSTRIKIDDEALRLGKRSYAARVFNQRVWSWLYYFDRSWCEANYSKWMKESSSTFGLMSQAATRRMYVKLGEKGSANASWPGAYLLRRLGFRAD